MISSGSPLCRSMTGEVRVSFCATNLNTFSNLPRSIASVQALGDALEVPYEVVVADGPSTDGAREWLEARSKADGRVRRVGHAERNRGYGRRRAFEASSGSTVVPFDTSIEYAPVYGDLLRAYLRLGTDRMLFSEICALSRSSITAVGGWRDLIGGEDIDLYVRVVERFGVIAVPLPLRDSQSRVLSAVERQARYVGGGRLSRAMRMYRVQRDQIIGANFRVRDLMQFNRRRSAGERFGRRVFFLVAYTGSKLRTIRPVVLPRNNYLMFRERLLRSMAAGDFRDLLWKGPPPQLLLTDDELDYLGTNVPEWNEYSAANPPLVGRK